MHLRVDSVSFTYNVGTPLAVPALEDVSFALNPGTILGIIGGTGSGKTTLVKHLNGLLKPTRGAVYLGHQKIEWYGEEIRRKVGVLFQRPERQLFGDTIFDDITYVLARFSALSIQEIEERVALVCEQVGLDVNEVRHLSPLRVSDGIKRKASLAAVLVNQPSVLVLDEPAAGLDVPSVADLVTTLSLMKMAKQRTIIIVSHDMDPFLELLDTLLVLHQGRIAAFGTPHEVYDFIENVPHIRSFLPKLMLLSYRLRKAGYLNQQTGFSIDRLADALVDTLRKQEKSL